MDIKTTVIVQQKDNVILSSSPKDMRRCNMMDFAHFFPFHFLIFLSCLLFSTNFAKSGQGLILSWTTIFSNIASTDDCTTDLESGQKGVKYSAFTPSRCFQVKDNLFVIF